jgi:hypothetical protein
MAVSISSLGIVPASESFVAFTRTMNFIVVSPISTGVHPRFYRGVD